jgi:hypothetical protein
MSKQQTKHTQTKTEVNAEQWLRLLSGTHRNGVNGNGHSTNGAAIEFPVVDLSPEYWLRLLSGAQADAGINGNGGPAPETGPQYPVVELPPEYWLRLLSGN